MLQPQRRNVVRWILGFVCILGWADLCAADGDGLDLSHRRGRIHGPTLHAPAVSAAADDGIVLPPVVERRVADRARDDVSSAKAGDRRVAPSPPDKRWFIHRFWLAKR